MATRTIEHRSAQAGRPALELVRSRKRRRTASAHARDGLVVVQLPWGLSEVEEERLIGSLVDRVVGRHRAHAAGGDQQLQARARELADRYVDGVRPTSVRWSGRMRRRWGSCTVGDGTIRLSRRLAVCPAFVRDYVLVHELAHLIVSDHSAAFHRIVDRFPDAARARGFLEGYEFAQAPLSLQEGAAGVADLDGDGDEDDGRDDEQRADLVD